MPFVCRVWVLCFVADFDTDPGDKNLLVETRSAKHLDCRHVVRFTVRMDVDGPGMQRMAREL